MTSLHNIDQGCDDLADWKLHPHDLVTNRFELAQASEAYALMATGQSGKVVVVFNE